MKEKTKHDYTVEAIVELAQSMIDNGFIVYLNKEKTYGVYSKPNCDKCVYFQFDLFGGYEFTSVCKPSRNHGSGCQLDNTSINVHSLDDMLNQPLPRWYNRSEKDCLTLSQYLSGWFQSSNYIQFKGESL